LEAETEPSVWLHSGGVEAGVYQVDLAADSTLQDVKTNPIEVDAEKHYEAR